jgi:hypothetical protein
VAANTSENRQSAKYRQTELRTGTNHTGQRRHLREDQSPSSTFLCDDLTDALQATEIPAHAQNTDNMKHSEC